MHIFSNVNFYLVLVTTSFLVLSIFLAAELIKKFRKYQFGSALRGLTSENGEIVVICTPEDYKMIFERSAHMCNLYWVKEAIMASCMVFASAITGAALTLVVTYVILLDGPAYFTVNPEVLQTIGFASICTAVMLSAALAVTQKDSISESIDDAVEYAMAINAVISDDEFSCEESELGYSYPIRIAN